MEFNPAYIGIFIVFALLVVFIVYSCVIKEKFTAPGLTLTLPPNWFPQFRAKDYDISDWKVKMYLDRYPLFKGQTSEEADDVASAYRLWKF